MENKQQQLLSELIFNNLIRVGNYEIDSGIYNFSPIDTLEGKSLEKINEFLERNINHLAFSTYSMGKVIFIANREFRFIQVKGVDSILQNNYLETNYGIEYILGKKNSRYPLCKMNSEYRYRGAMKKEEIIKEMYTNEMLKSAGIRTSDDMNEVVMFNQAQCDILNLPRPNELFQDYLKRKRYNLETSTILGEQMMFGQIKRTQNNIFRISDLESALKNKDIKKIQLMFQFSIYCLGKELKQELNLNSYLLNFSSILGTQVGSLIDNMIINFNPSHNQDITLSCEFCDENFSQFTLDETKSGNDYYVHDELHKQQIYLQIYTFASSLKIIIDCLELLGINMENIIINNYIDAIIKRIGKNRDNCALLYSLMDEVKNETVINAIIRVSNTGTKPMKVNNYCISNGNLYQGIRKKINGQLNQLISFDSKNTLKRKQSSKGNISISFIIFTIMITLTLLFISMVYLLY